MRRYWIDTPPEVNKHVLIQGDLFGHIYKVCRESLGGRFELICNGKLFLVETQKLLKTEAEVMVLKETQLPELSRPYIHLCLSVPKFTTFETVLEKAVEMGVYAVRPFFSARSFVKSNEKISEGRWSRWDRIIKGAVQQSGASHCLKIHSIQSLEQVLDEFNRQTKVLGLFAYEGQSEKTLKEFFSLQGQQQPSDVWLFVGGEGGFDKSEIDIFKRYGMESVSFGQQVLRVETACVALLAVIKYEYL